MVVDHWSMLEQNTVKKQHNTTVLSPSGAETLGCPEDRVGVDGLRRGDVQTGRADWAGQGGREAGPGDAQGRVIGRQLAGTY